MFCPDHKLHGDVGKSELQWIRGGLRRGLLRVSAFACTFYGAALSGADLTLGEALEEAMAAAPQLEAANAEIEASAVRSRRAGKWSNPEVSVEAENFGGSGAFAGSAAAEYTASVSQNLELGGRRTARLGLAGVERQQAEVGRRLVELELQAEVYRRFASLLHAQAFHELAVERWESADRMAKAVATKQRSGEVGGIDDARAQVDVSLAQVARTRSEVALRRARVDLASLLGRVQPDFEKAMGAIESLPAPVDPETMRRALEASPSWRMSLLPVEARVHALRLAQAAARPEVSALIGHRWFEEGNANAWVAGLSVSLPLWDRPRDALLEAQAQDRRTRAEARVLQRRLEDAVRQAPLRKRLRA